MSAPDTRVDLAGLVLKNPVLTASGCFGYGTEYEGLCDIERIGGLCTKGLSLAPRPGNPPPRIREVEAGMLNSIGLENIGVAAFVREKAPRLEGVDTAVIANLFGVAVEEYAALCEQAEACARIDAVELNVSCPNVHEGGVEFGIDPKMAAEVTRASRAATKKPLIVKLSPNAGDGIVEVARAVSEAGADAVSVINTISGMAIDVKRRRPWIARTTGGLSGPAIRPIALRMVHLVHTRVGIPIIGIGGIGTWEDAAAFLLAGARAVQVGTVCFSDPAAPVRIAEGLRDWLEEEGVSSIDEVVGALKTGAEAWPGA
jgi:dihydroorotate dehydrogenase (NAD+) catalytic subunit